MYRVSRFLGLVWLLGAVGPAVQAALPTAIESGIHQTAAPLAVFGVAMFPLDESGGLERIASPVTNSTWVHGMGKRGLEVVWSEVEPVSEEYYWDELNTVAPPLQNAFDNSLKPIMIVRGNTYLGKNEVDCLDFAFWVGAGANVSIEGNTISNNLGEVNDLSSAGIWVESEFSHACWMDVATSTATITANTILSSRIGIHVRA